MGARRISSCSGYQQLSHSVAWQCASDLVSDCALNVQPSTSLQPCQAECTLSYVLQPSCRYFNFCSCLCARQDTSGCVAGKRCTTVTEGAPPCRSTRVAGETGWLTESCHDISRPSGGKPHPLLLRYGCEQHLDLQCHRGGFPRLRRQPCPQVGPENSII